MRNFFKGLTSVHFLLWCFMGGALRQLEKEKKNALAHKET